MLRDACAAEAACCAADPGSTILEPDLSSLHGSRLCEAALHAASRPGHEKLGLDSISSVAADLPVGQISKFLPGAFNFCPVLLPKIFGLRRRANHRH
jgi:hypothetical protein